MKEARKEGKKESKKEKRKRTESSRNKIESINPPPVVVDTVVEDSIMDTSLSVVGTDMTVVCTEPVPPVGKTLVTKFLTHCSSLQHQWQMRSCRLGSQSGWLLDCTNRQSRISWGMKMGYILSLLLLLLLLLFLLLLLPLLLLLLVLPLLQLLLLLLRLLLPPPPLRFFKCWPFNYPRYFALQHARVLLPFIAIFYVPLPFMIVVCVPLSFCELCSCAF